MDTITELKQERAVHIREAREILDLAESEARDLTAEEQQNYDRLITDAESKGARAGRLEEQRRLEVNLDADTSTEQRGGIDPRLTQGDPRGLAEQIEERARAYNDAFDLYLRHGMSELDPEQRKSLRSGFVPDKPGDMQFGDIESRAQSKTAAAGGYTVPTTLQNKIVEYLLQAGTARENGSTTIVTGGGEDLQLPKLTAHGAANWITEGNPVTATDETFAQATLKSYKAVRLVLASIELLEDSAVDIDGLLAKAIGISIGVLENTAYYVGDGTGKPTGMLAAAGGTTAGKTTASITAVTSDEIIDFQHSINPAYRRNAKWVYGDTAVVALRKLKDTTGQYLWQPGLQAGVPDTLLGKPILIDPDIPAYGTSTNKFGLYGDFSGYTIRDVGRNGPARESSTADVGAFSVRRLDERYADNLQVGFLAYHRTDGLLLDPNAVKHIAHA